jgi:hypothetical protein
MILDALTAELRDMREVAYAMRMQMREARQKVKSNPHLALDLIERSEMNASVWLDGLSRVDRILRDDLDPLMRRREGPDEDRTAEISDRLAAIEEALEALRHEAGGSPLRAVR